VHRREVYEAIARGEAVDAASISMTVASDSAAPPDSVRTDDARRDA
jgi:hypothetical protein